MSIVFSLKENDCGRWSVCRDSVALFHKMQLGPAIKLAREVAREEHRWSGRPVTVLLPGPASPIPLARYEGAQAAA